MEESLPSQPESNPTPTSDSSTNRALGELRADMTKRIDDVQSSLSQQMRELAETIGTALKPPELPVTQEIKTPEEPPLEVIKEEPPIRKLRRPGAIGKKVTRRG